jgi:hypothetical protein
VPPRLWRTEVLEFSKDSKSRTTESMYSPRVQAPDALTQASGPINRSNMDATTDKWATATTTQNKY